MSFFNLFIKRLICLTVVLCFSATTGFCLDWKTIHQEADVTSASNAWMKLQKDEESLEYLYLLALTYLNIHKDKDAEISFRKMQRIDENSIEAKWGLAETLRRDHRLEDSKSYLDEVLKVDPSFAPALITLAYVKYTEKEFKESIELANKVIELGRENVDLSNYTRAYLIIGGSKGMLAYFGGPIAKIVNGLQVLPNIRKAEELQPDSAAVLFGLGSFYFLAPMIAGGNRDKARAYFEKTIEKDPFFADAYVRLAQLDKMKGDMEQYYVNLNKVKKMDPENKLLNDFESGKCNFACISMEE